MGLEHLICQIQLLQKYLNGTHIMDSLEKEKIVKLIDKYIKEGKYSEAFKLIVKHNINSFLVIESVLKKELNIKNEINTSILSIDIDGNQYYFMAHAIQVYKRNRELKNKLLNLNKLSDGNN